MSDKESRWVPYNKDGSTHDCKKKNRKQEVTLEAMQIKLGIIVNVEVDETRLTNWECFICGQVIQKYSLVSELLPKHKAENNINPLYEVIYADWRKRLRNRNDESRISGKILY
jgi:hypothetical protein